MFFMLPKSCLEGAQVCSFYLLLLHQGPTGLICIFSQIFGEFQVRPETFFFFIKVSKKGQYSAQVSKT